MRVSRYIYLHILQWVTGCRFLVIYTYTSFSESQGVGFSLYILTYPSVRHWVSVSRYIYLHVSFSESLGESFSLYILTCLLQWVTGCWFLAIYILTYLLHWLTGCRFLAIYTYISPSVSHWVSVSRYKYLHISFSESLGESFSLYLLTYPSVSHWVRVSRYIYLHISFSESLGESFSLYILTYPSVSHWVRVSRYIYLHISFSESLGVGFSLYILTYLLHWVTGWRFLAINTYISPSLSHWVEVSPYIYLHISFIEPLGVSFLLYILTYLLQWVTGCRFLAIYTYISPISLCVGDSNYLYVNDENTQQKQWMYCW